MKLALPDSLWEFFQQHQLLELEDIFSPQDLSLLSKSHETLDSKSPWSPRRNTWQENPSIKKLLQHSSLGEIAAFLYKKRPIRLAYTLWLSPMQTPLSLVPKTLSEISCLDPLLGGVLLCLENTTREVPPMPDLCKQTAGHALFFSATYPLPFPDLCSLPGQKSLLIALAPAQLRYKLEPQDPSTHLLKKRGYAFGDLVKEDEVPYLYH
ncbi:MAG: hypothetical protein FJZ58_01465 [Chlamydiae bacterium]|nr:hypothetical protein [Chlamydiota bacterium]